MPQSLSNVLCHIVFSTKDRAPFITSEIAPKLHAYLAAAIRGSKSECYRVGGVADHVHLAVRLARTISQSDLLESVKKESSKWMKTQGEQFSSFSWQRGFGCFSVSPTQNSLLLKYISNQEEHHKTETFQDEYRKLCKKNGVEFDERYVWD